MAEQQAVFKWQYYDSGCVDKKPLPFDFKLKSWKSCQVPFIVELDGVQHFVVDRCRSVNEFEVGRKHDLIKMRWALGHGLPVVRLTSRAITYFNSSTWQCWLQRVVTKHISGMGAERRLIVLEDTARYHQMYAECLRDDTELGPFVVFEPL